MVDHLQISSGTICCMCGDVGFPEKLFRCNKCRFRLQHSYCSNYYSESAAPIETCDWCRSEERNIRHGGGGCGSGKNSSKYNYSAGGSGGGGATSRSEYAGGERIKQHHDPHLLEEVGGGGGGGGGSSAGEGKAAKSASPRPTARRYKLLKDVMC